MTPCARKKSHLFYLLIQGDNLILNYSIMKLIKLFKNWYFFWKFVGKEDIDKENGAHEVFDAPLGQNGFEGLAFGDNDIGKNAEKHFEKNHIDTMGVGDKDRKIYDQDQPEYKDLQNDVQLEENDEDGK